ncbi:MAG: hypothetical protein HC859_06400 [Bacteroidia bacterium]|nr:hypothetical protein [Bacteroidia bacterium]
MLGIVTLARCSDDAVLPENPADMPYSVVIDPANFLDAGITGNTFFPLATGKRFVYEGKNEDNEPVRVETEFTMDTRVVMGVVCAVVRDRAYENGELVEDTDDWYAQDVDGNVWYFGEATQEIEGGSVVNTHGSWEAGVDGALPGIIMLAKPISGMWYRQEYYENEAEDVAQILSLVENVTVGHGAYTNCLQVAEWNLLEPGIIEHKFYAPGVGNVKTIAVKGESGFEELVSIEDI